MKQKISKIKIREIRIPLSRVIVNGILALPESASGIVIFVHGSGSSRFSPRNSFVASELQMVGLATLLIDLLTMEEEGGRANVFDIDLLSSRLYGVTSWIMDEPETKNLPIGYFGASTGAAAAIQVAAKLPSTIKAVVSRGGRPDLALTGLSELKSPTLLIVGGLDDIVIDLNKSAFQEIKSEKNLVIIPGATHLFEEPGTLAMVAKLASDWFLRYLKP